MNCHFLLCFYLGLNIFSAARGICLDPHVAQYVKKIVQEFTICSTATRFDNIILPPRTGNCHDDYMLPKVFVWCPIDHYKVEVRCPVHNVPLIPGVFTDEVIKKSILNPRLVYDIRGNILLIQRIYRCNHRGGPHRYFSVSESILRSLPLPYSHAVFPFTMFHKSACTRELVDFLEAQITQGVSFFQICEAIAALNFKAHRERKNCYSLVYQSNCHSKDDEKDDDFYLNPLYSFPSNDNLMHIFLNDFQHKKDFYEKNMEARVSNSKVLTCDHTFKVSKYIGARRGDDKFVKQFENLFIVLNDNHEVVAWRLTRSTAFLEVRTLLQGIRDKEVTADSVKRIIVDDCCRVRAQYLSIFPKAEVKLDLFHAVQRVTKSIPKNTEFSKKFSRNFTLIFRQNGDYGEKRAQRTPNPGNLEQNLNNFLKEYRNFFMLEEMRKTSTDIEHLREHIRKGCLSDLNPGEGTECNESLHHTLNKTLLCGATTIGPELVMAILSLVFYVTNCKKGNKKHKGNARVVPIIPAELEALATCLSNNDRERDVHVNVDSCNSVASLDWVWNQKSPRVPFEEPEACLESSLIVLETIEELLRNDIYVLILKNMMALNKILNNIDNDNTDRTINVYDLPGLMPCLSSSVLSPYVESASNEEESMNILIRNLSSFNLGIDKIAGDGDCAFRSVIVQVRKTTEWIENVDGFLKHLQDLGLGKTLDDDVYTLRQVFVDHVQSNEYYQMLTGIEKENLNFESERFRDEGTYSGDMGDLIMKVCADVLGVPIITISSYVGARFVPFIPGKTIIQRPIYLAYNASGPGHYDGTASLAESAGEVSGGSTTKRTGCSCGKNKSDKEQACCIPEGGEPGLSRCPCVASDNNCNRNCRCKRCDNKKTNFDKQTFKSQPTNIYCRCGRGEAKKHDNFVACSDEKRKSKCPCLRQNQECSFRCACRNCGNCDNKEKKESDKHARPPKKRMRLSPSHY